MTGFYMMGKLAVKRLNEKTPDLLKKTSSRGTIAKYNLTK